MALDEAVSVGLESKSQIPLTHGEIQRVGADDEELKRRVECVNRLAEKSGGNQEYDADNQLGPEDPSPDFEGFAQGEVLDADAVRTDFADPKTAKFLRTMRLVRKACRT